MQVLSLDRGAVELELAFRVADIAVASKAKSEVFDLIFRHAKAAGHTLATPREAVGQAFPEPNAVAWR